MFWPSFGSKPLALAWPEGAQAHQISSLGHEPKPAKSHSLSQTKLWPKFAISVTLCIAQYTGKIWNKQHEADLAHLKIRRLVIDVIKHDIPTILVITCSLLV